MPLPPVDELSASASDAESQAERDLGAHDLMGRRRRVRRRILKKKRVPCWRQKGDALTKTLSILVQKKCGGRCRLCCLSQFKDGDNFEKLVQFRENWSELHKLDQDRLVDCLQYLFKHFAAFFGFCVLEDCRSMPRC